MSGWDGSWDPMPEDEQIVHKPAPPEDLGFSAWNFFGGIGIGYMVADIIFKVLS